MLNPSKRNANDATSWIVEEQLGSRQSGPLSRDEEIDGDSTAEQIDGKQGDDSIEAGAGADTLEGGQGDDQIAGEQGNDSIEAGTGSDTLDGGKGTDSLEGGLGNDVLDGGKGNDDLDGDKGTDSLDGGLGNDILDGGKGDDVLNGGDGDDLLIGGKGSDTYQLSRGDDTIRGYKGGDAIELSQELIDAGLSRSDITIEPTKIDGKEAALLSYTLDGTRYTTTVIGVKDADEISVQKTSINSRNVKGSDNTRNETKGVNDLDKTEHDGTKTWRDNGDNGDNNYFFKPDNKSDAITGGNKEDYIFGKKGDDVIDGDAGDDTLYGNPGEDKINGGYGADYIDGGDDNDVLNGGDGKDSFAASKGDDVIEDFTYGEDILIDNGKKTWDLDGKVNLDEETKSVEIKVLKDGKHEGTTTIYVANYEDFKKDIDASKEPEVPLGPLTVEGSDDGDRTDGESLANPEEIEGTESWSYNNLTNQIFKPKSQEVESINGKGGNDYIFTLGGNDTINGGKGADTLYGGNGSDEVRGDSGNDLLYGNYDDDTVRGGVDNDTLNGGGGNDRLIGDEGNDHLYGNDDEDKLYGGTGNDTLNGGAGNDELFGGEDSDKFEASPGDDTIKDFVFGIDELIASNDYEWDRGNIVLNSSNKSATINVLNKSTGKEAGTTVLTVENFEEFEEVFNKQEKPSFLPSAASDPNTKLIHKSDNKDFEAIGGKENNIISVEGISEFADFYYDVEERYYSKVRSKPKTTSSEDSYSIDGKQGDDTITGGNKDDYLHGASGEDKLDGGLGNDRLLGGSDNDTIEGGDGDDKLFGWDGNDSLDGGTGNDYLKAENGDDTLDGGEGDDTLDGGEGNDTFDGGNGNDSLIGGGGSDRLRGLGGDDTLVGGDGNDTFFASEGNDVIEDFTFGEDSLEDATYFSLDRNNPSFDDDNQKITLDVLKKDGGKKVGTTTIKVENYDDLIAAINKENEEIGFPPIGASDPETKLIYNGEEKGINSFKALGGKENNLITPESTNEFADFYYEDNSRYNTKSRDDSNKPKAVTTNDQFDLDGGEGDDTLLGGTKNDILNGGSGNDELYGSKGRDRLDGGDDNDLLDGGDQRDTMNGGGGDDKLVAGDGDDILKGKGDDDRLFGNSGNDVLNGGKGNDWLDGGEGKDSFNLSPGADYIVVDIKEDKINLNDKYTASVLTSPSQPDSDGNSIFTIGLFQNNKDIGTTTIQYKPADLGVSNELPVPPMPGLPDPISEDLPQNEGNNKPNGSGQGGTGDNSGGNGNGEKPGDGLEDAPGADNNGDNSTDDKPGSEGSIDGEPITPPVDLNPGQPEPEATALRVIDVDPSPKNNAFESVESGSQKPDTVLGSNGIDKLRGKKKNDVLKGKKGADYLYGENGADSLMGGKGADILQGGNGKDELKGGAKNDVLYGGKKADVLTGNAGKDTFILSKGKDVITDFKVGKDAIGLVYALDLNFKQKGDDLLIKGNDGVKTLLLDTDKDKFLTNFPDNLEIVPAVEINLI